MIIDDLGNDEYWVRRTPTSKGLTISVMRSGQFRTSDYGYPSREPPKDICKALSKFLIKS